VALINGTATADFTWGVELELSNVDRHASLHGFGEWNTKDYTIVNDCGVANDPKGELFPWGGEVNTAPTITLGGQRDCVQAIFDTLRPTAKGPMVNYRSNLHIHIGHPALGELETLKRILKFNKLHGRWAVEYADPLDLPPRGCSVLERRRHLRNRMSHHYQLPEGRYEEAMAATNLDDFFVSIAGLTAAGKRNWPGAVRPAINVFQAKDTGTVEFRHFFGTDSPKEITGALLWCTLYLERALECDPDDPHVFDDVKATDVYAQWKLPLRRPFQEHLEAGWRDTNLHTNTRAVVKERIARLKAAGQLEGWI
jgi:hypothetical protein